MECSALCQRNGDCQSFNIGVASPYHCQLLSLGQSDIALSSSTYVQYFDINGKSEIGLLFTVYGETSAQVFDESWNFSP